jgi:hypothetical protein
MLLLYPRPLKTWHTVLYASSSLDYKRVSGFLARVNNQPRHWAHSR